MRLLFGIVEPVHKAVKGVNEKIGYVKRRVYMVKGNLYSVRDVYSQTGDAAEMFFRSPRRKQSCSRLTYLHFQGCTLKCLEGTLVPL